MIEEILDILEILRMSKLLCMDTIRALAMRIIAGLGADPHVSQALCLNDPFRDILTYAIGTGSTAAVYSCKICERQHDMRVYEY